MKVSLEEKIKNVSVKPQIDAHQSFLLSLYGSTREDELTMSSLNELEKRAFIKQQFRLKEDDYKRKFFDAEFLILYRKKKPIGRVVYRIRDSIHLIDIALVKKSRGLGIGSGLIQQFLTYSQNHKITLKLSVAQDNFKALRLYQRLGLQVLKQENHYLMMQSV